MLKLIFFLILKKNKNTNQNNKKVKEFKRTALRSFSDNPTEEYIVNNTQTGAEQNDFGGEVSLKRKKSLYRKLQKE